ncbi:DNA-binding protein HEXBP [Iris pallida]|uniref:DNA-binding protein HEXBP n=1 Tax=Iris pallida TaxID=29817 RepID=A0AAX6ECF8_IRIPA|nr:DNA-binding protein HEXBP [Iris pallida]
MAQNEATEPEWDLAKIPCYCEVISLCKILTSKHLRIVDANF